MGRATAAVAGLPDYAFLLVPHPMGRLRPDELRARAEEILPAVVALLLAQPAPAVDGPAPWGPDTLGLGSQAVAQSERAAEPSASEATPTRPSPASEAEADTAGPAERWPPLARE